MKLIPGRVWIAIALAVVGCGRSEKGGAPPEVIGASSSALTVLTRSAWTSDFNGTAGDTANALDGNLSTGWSSGRNALNNDAFTVDMKTRQTFGELTIDAGSATSDYLRGFQVRVSDDNATWTTVATATGTSALVNVAFAVQTARYVQIKLTAGFGSWWTIKELTVWSPVLSRTDWVATASASPTSDTPDKALDGTASTRWSTTADQAPGQYFQVDLQSKQSFNQLTLDAGTSTGKYPRGYEVYVSNDGTTWGSAVATGTGTTDFISITLPWQWARYVKVVQTATSAGNVWAIHELNLYGAPADLAVLSQAGWTATKSPAGEGAASLAFDGNATTTRWSTNPSDQAPGQYFRVDLGAQRTFSQITLDTTPVATDYPAGYEVRVSNDDVTYSAPVATGTPSTAYVTISFAPQTARYIKITQTGTKAARWTIYELNVWAPALSRAGWLVSSSATTSGNTVTRAMDNNTGTRWDTSADQTSSANQFFQVDMITPHTFNEISLDAGASPNNYPRGYTVKVSNDGSNWTSIATGTGTSGLTTIKFLTQTARLIKIEQTGTASPAAHWSIYEFNVWRGLQACDAGCTASDQCHDAGTCDVYTGVCTNPNKANNTACNDSNACTTGEVCTAGVCGGGSTVTCTGADQCHTVGACVPATGCPAAVAKTNGTSCDDGNACTQTDTCQAGTCTGANPVVCEERQCNYPGTCNPATGVCAYQQKGDWSNCDDGNPCSVREACFSGVCTAVTNKVCAAQDQCHLPGTCDPSTGNCSNPVAADDTSCNDGNACTGTSTCQAGTCSGSVTVTCSSTNPNEVVSCDPAAQAAYPTDDLVALWHLDGDYRDATENANHWSVIAGSNVVKVVPGKQGGAYEFGQGVCLGNNATWSNEVFEGSGVTFAAWVKPTGPCTGTHDLFRRDWQLDVQTACTESGATGISAGINLGAGPFYTFPYSTPAGNLPPDQWSMVAVTWDKLEGVLHIYVNGTEVATKPAAGTLARGTPYMSLGCYFVGVIDEAAWYRRALTPTELTQLMSTPNACKATPRCPDPDPCRTGVWDPATNSCTSAPKTDGTSCSDGNGCTQNDVCHAGVCTAGLPVWCGSPTGVCEVSSCDPTWREPDPGEVLATWHFDGDGVDGSGQGRHLSGLETGLVVPGKFGDAVHFDAAATSCANRTSGPGESFVNEAGVTLSAWVKPDLTCSPYHQGTIIERSGELGMRVECYGGALRVNPSINWANIATQAFLTPGVWSHVVTTYARPTGSVRVYINGVDAGGGSVAPNTELGTGVYGRSAAIDVGCGAGATIDEANVLRRPLTAAEVANLYAAPIQCKVQPKTCASTGFCDLDGTCNPTTGECERPQRPNGVACDDGNACTQGDVCQGGTCGGAPVTCTAQDECHSAGTCDPVSGCSNPELPSGSYCEGTDRCFRTHSCQHGVCQGVIPVVCTAADSCHTDGACEPSTGACSTPTIPGSSCEIVPGGPSTFSPGAGRDCSQATGINGSGQLVGYWDDCLYPGQQAIPFVTVDDVQHQLPVPTGLSAVIATAIGNAGHAIGNGVDASGTAKTVVYRPETPGVGEILPFSVATRATALGRNTTPKVFGQAATGGIGAYPWQWVSYDLPAAGQSATLSSIAPPTGYVGDGQIAGADEYGVRLAGFYTLPGAGRRAMILRTATEGPVDMNDPQVVDAQLWNLEEATGISGANVIGFGTRDSQRRAFRADLDSRIVTDLGSLDPMDSTLVHEARGINGAGTVVGTAGHYDPGQHFHPERAFAYSTASEMVDINDLVIMPPGWTLVAAAGINDANEVAATAQDTHGKRVAYKVKLSLLPDAQCQGQNDGTACDDGNGCTQGDHCSHQVCVGGAPVVCVALDSCHVPRICDPSNGVCSNLPAVDGTACDDQDACTTGDACDEGQCAGDPVTCVAKDQCHYAGTCDSASGMCSDPTEKTFPGPHGEPIVLHAPTGCEPTAAIEWRMMEHYPGLNEPPEPRRTHGCPGGDKYECTASDGSPGCNKDALPGTANAGGNLDHDFIVGGQRTACVGQPCVPGEIAKCNTGRGNYAGGIHTCLANKTWEPCKPYDACNGLDDDRDGNIDKIKDAAGNVDPVSTCVLPVSIWDKNHKRGFDTVLNGCSATEPTLPASPIVQWIWEIQGQPLITASICASTFTFPAEGDYPTTLTVVTANGHRSSTTRTISIKNKVIVSMGDSIASGEGNPDAPFTTFGGGPYWQMRRCHRSLKSGHAVSARMLEDADTHTSVSFFSTGCSGAGINDGLITTYGGQETLPGDLPLDLPPQLKVVGDTFGTARIDALLLQIGANDAHFSKHIEKCAIPSVYIPNAAVLQIIALAEASNLNLATATFFQGLWAAVLLDPSLTEIDLTAGGCMDKPLVEHELSCLNNFYCELNARMFGMSPACGTPVDCGLKTNLGTFTPLSLSPDRVYIGEYPDPSHLAPGQICPQIVLKGAVADNIGLKPTPEMIVPGLVAIGAVGPLIEALSSVELAAVAVLIANHQVFDDDAVISHDRLVWAYDNVIAPLNETVRTGSQAQGWTVLSGLNETTMDRQGFDSHGLCSPTPWIRSYGESKQLQVNHEGAFHPNYPYDDSQGPALGHGAYAKLYYERLAQDLFNPLSSSSPHPNP